MTHYHHNQHQQAGTSLEQSQQLSHLQDRTGSTAAASTRAA
jgi:hypothetical protein